MLRNKRIDRYMPLSTPHSQRLSGHGLAFYYVLGFSGLIMFLIGFFGLPMPLLMRWFGGA